MKRISGEPFELDCVQSPYSLMLPLVYQTGTVVFTIFFYWTGTNVFTILFTGLGRLYLLFCLLDWDSCIYYLVYWTGTIVFTILFSGLGRLYLLSCLLDWDDCIYYLVYWTGTVVFTILFTGLGRLYLLSCQVMTLFFEPYHERVYLQGVRSGKTQTSLLSYRN